MGDDPPSTRARPTVVGGDEQGADRIDVDLAALCHLAARVLAEEGVPAAAEMNLLLVGAEEISQLNAQHMGGDGPTDVLSFPIDGAGSGDEEPVLVGDVAVCPAVAAANAAEHSVTVADELALLVVHGTLHLLGHDHTTAAGAAAMRERELRYAGRSGATAP
jgi:probable rRNA maturation factor